ncbi:hypothetical protein D1BOALGB6SA_2150 [Olavius sp. associated proteobacterium Delta 1]|nr:hypothetical protein D1BOALGB6SA_2150 [Olavius sp. associated proteobacterium Delta 1]
MNFNDIQKPESRISQYFQWSSLQQRSWISIFYATIGFKHRIRIFLIRFEGLLRCQKQ